MLQFHSIFGIMISKYKCYKSRTGQRNDLLLYLLLSSVGISTCIQRSVFQQFLPIWNEVCSWELHIRKSGPGWLAGPRFGSFTFPPDQLYRKKTTHSMRLSRTTHRRLCRGGGSYSQFNVGGEYARDENKFCFRVRISGTIFFLS